MSGAQTISLCRGMAKRFVFNLETLRRVRQLREREAKRKVAAQRAELARVEQLIVQTLNAVARQQQELLDGQQQTRLDPLTLQRGRAWIAALRRQLADHHAWRAVLQDQLRARAAELRAARTQARVVEKLRDRRWEEYVHDRDRQAQAAADELAQQLHGHPPL